MAITALLRLGRLTGKSVYLEHADKALRLFAQQMSQQTMSYGQMLVALDDWLGPIEEFAVFSGRDAEMGELVLGKLYETHRPRKLVTGPPLVVPVLENREAINGQVTIYRCLNQTCEMPWVGMKQIRQKLES